MIKDLFEIVVIVSVNVIIRIWVHLDYENCKCIKKLVDKLVEEFSKNVDGNEMIQSNYENVCNSCTIYIVLFVIAFLIIIGFSSVFIYLHWHYKRVAPLLLILILTLKQKTIQKC